MNTPCIFQVVADKAHSLMPKSRLKELLDEEYQRVKYCIIEECDTEYTSLIEELRHAHKEVTETNLFTELDHNYYMFCGGHNLKM